MKMPGFTAQNVFPAAYNLVVGAIGQDNAPGRAGCMTDCMDSGKSFDYCRKFRCPIGSPNYKCTNVDNSYNHYTCLAGVKAAELACDGVAGPFSFICGWIADQAREDCPPATICV